MKSKLILISVLLLGFFAGVSRGEWVQRNWDGVCFDLNANGGSGPGNEGTNCRVYVKNNGHVNSEVGIHNYAFNDCIYMTNPSRWSYTYIWSSCDDALWIDQMQVLTTWCNIFNSGNGCQTYGVDNRKGWCISQDYRDGLGHWRYFTPSGCFKMLRLGKPGHRDSRVWGYQWNYRRALQEEYDSQLADISKRVKECEADPEKKSCEDVVDEVFKLYEELDNQGWVTTDPEEDDIDQNSELGEEGKKVAGLYEQEVKFLKKQILQLKKADKPEQN